MSSTPHTQVNILDSIVAQRRRRLEELGPELGHPVPASRKVPMVKFGRAPFVIAEIKRRSPSRGSIDSIYDPAAQARLYRSKGIKTVSILTEEDHFGGTLSDLMAVKEALPSLAVLRKDFLLTVEDVEVAFRAGADAVLLIASILEKKQLEELYRRAVELGMAPLVELHSPEDLRKAEPLRPEFTGINSRDLTSFRTDPAHPIKMRSLITWPSAVVYESGIRSRETARLPGRSGFAGILVGEAAVRDPELVPDLIRGFETGRAARGGCPLENKPEQSFFWETLFRGSTPAAQEKFTPAATAQAAPSSPASTAEHQQSPRSAPPLVKICGLTRPKDVAAADEAGADILGFILATASPRAVSTDFIRSIGTTRALKVAVVVGADSEPMPAVRQLLKEGILDGVQFHGREAPEACAAAAYPYYKALPLRSSEDIQKIQHYHCPRVLVDAYHQGASGGTGRRIDDTLVEAAAEVQPLWLAGGLNAENITEVVQRFHPELVDASSGLETAPGIKDPELIRRFIQAAKAARSGSGYPSTAQASGTLHTDTPHILEPTE